MYILSHLLVSPNVTRVTCDKNQTPLPSPDTIVMHYTGGGDARSSALYLADPATKASAHVVVARDGQIFQLVPFDKRAWHAGASALAGREHVNAFSIGEYIEAEQIPLYGGALVSDGVDDYAVSDEVIDEEIGGFVFHGEVITKCYAFATGWSKDDVFLYRLENITKGGNATGNVETTDLSNSSVIGFSKSPLIPNKILSITPSMDLGRGQSALYQLRLIKTQPTDTQLEAIKWQCRKEHDDYLIHRGWKEVE